MTAPKVAAIGECMLELSAAPGSPGSTPLNMGFGGDTLNTAIYLSRLGIAADYITALGDDNLSDWMLESWRNEGVGTGCVRQLPGRLPGLYLIETDECGERRFSYWRREAPARELFDDESQVAALGQALAASDLVYLSGISLSLYGQRGRERLFEMLLALRQRGVRIAFDGNYRPAGWPDSDLARDAFTRACSLADIVLPTFDDEQALFGDVSSNATLERIGADSGKEIVLKQGAQGCVISAGGRRIHVPAETVAKPVDTTAAGDSFNAGYLAGRLLGQPVERAAVMGHRLAGAVIQCRGAILPLAQMPQFSTEA